MKSQRNEAQSTETRSPEAQSTELQSTEAQIIEITLEPCELLYVLQLLGAPSLFGIEESRLFPIDQSTRDTMLSDGYEALQAHGWLTADEEEQHAVEQHTIDPTLMLMVAVAAAPQVVLITTQYLWPLDGASADASPDLPQPAKQIATHYLADQMAIEQIYGADGRYHLVSLPDEHLTIKRIVDAVAPAGFSQELPQGPASILVPSDITRIQEIGASNQAQQQQKLEELFEEIDVAERDRAQLMKLMTEGELLGDIQVGRAVGSDLFSLKTVTLLNGAGTTWLVHDTERGTCFHPVDSTTLAQFLTQLVEEVRLIQN